MPTYSISRPLTTLLKFAPASLTYRLHFFTPNYHHQNLLAASHQIRAFSRFTSPSSHVHTNFFVPSIRNASGGGAWGFNPGVQGVSLAGSTRWIVTTDMAVPATDMALPATQNLKPRQKNMKLRCTEFDHSGAVKTTAGEFLKSELCAQHGLQPRDLRKIDSHMMNQMPAILVRSEAILVNLAHIRALIKADLVVLFDSFGSTDSYNQSIFVYDLQERLRQSGAKAGGLPFEFRALEAIFISTVSSIQSEIEVLETFVTRLLLELEERIEQRQLKELLQYTKKLSKFEKDVLSIQGAITEVLEQDEDLAAMFLTAKKSGSPRKVNDHEEIELLLETYLKQVEEIGNRATALLSNMRSTEEISNIILDANRNSLLIYELKLTMGTLGVGAGGLLASIFGMNLHSFFEEDPYAFGVVSGTAVAIVGLIFWISLRKMRKLTKIY
ncbi:hypothetical protein BC937DRAFT_88800 [Endogone sp. FLAS-F59071]|nr:hypothetical protein BC937DRAFT_88800 [Endogone sp. FLAS-F59071]|eukprot:RUS18415.1 hypothetical protein BC937DRAFT_88800 [Endogone sp. FLAS-F59071]